MSGGDPVILSDPQSSGQLFRSFSSQGTTSRAGPPPPADPNHPPADSWGSFYPPDQDGRSEYSPSPASDWPSGNGNPSSPPPAAGNTPVVGGRTWESSSARQHSAAAASALSTLTPSSHSPYGDHQQYSHQNSQQQEYSHAHGDRIGGGSEMPHRLNGNHPHHQHHPRQDRYPSHQQESLYSTASAGAYTGYEESSLQRSQDHGQPNAGDPGMMENHSTPRSYSGFRPSQAPQAGHHHHHHHHPPAHPPRPPHHHAHLQQPPLHSAHPSALDIAQQQQQQLAALEAQRLIGSIAETRSVGGSQAFGRPGGSRTLAEYIICGDFKKNNCNRQICQYVHNTNPHALRGADVCVDFRKGHCVRDICRYIHNINPNARIKRTHIYQTTPSHFVLRNPPPPPSQIGSYHPAPPLHSHHSHHNHHHSHAGMNHLTPRSASGVYPPPTPAANQHPRQNFHSQPTGYTSSQQQQQQQQRHSSYTPRGHPFSSSSSSLSAPQDHQNSPSNVDQVARLMEQTSIQYHSGNGDGGGGHGSFLHPGPLSTRSSRSSSSSAAAAGGGGGGARTGGGSISPSSVQQQRSHRYTFADAETSHHLAQNPSSSSHSPQHGRTHQQHSHHPTESGNLESPHSVRSSSSVHRRYTNPNHSLPSSDLQPQQQSYGGGFSPSAQSHKNPQQQQQQQHHHSPRRHRGHHRSRSTPVLCDDFLNGVCSKTNCSFAHNLDPYSPQHRQSLQQHHHNTSSVSGGRPPLSPNSAISDASSSSSFSRRDHFHPQQQQQVYQNRPPQQFQHRHQQQQQDQQQDQQHSPSIQQPSQLTARHHHYSGLRPGMSRIGSGGHFGHSGSSGGGGGGGGVMRSESNQSLPLVGRNDPQHTAGSSGEQPLTAEESSAGTAGRGRQAWSSSAADSRRSFWSPEDVRFMSSSDWNSGRSALPRIDDFPLNEEEQNSHQSISSTQQNQNLRSRETPRNASSSSSSTAVLNSSAQQRRDSVGSQISQLSQMSLGNHSSSAFLGSPRISPMTPPLDGQPNHSQHSSTSLGPSSASAQILRIKPLLEENVDRIVERNAGAAEQEQQHEVLEDEETFPPHLRISQQHFSSMGNHTGSSPFGGVSHHHHHHSSSNGNDNGRSSRHSSQLPSTHPFWWTEQGSQSSLVHSNSPDLRGNFESSQ